MRLTVEEDQLHFCFSLGLRSSFGSSAQRTTWWLEGGTSSRMSWLWRGTSTKVQGLSVQMNCCLLWTDFFVVIAGDVYVHADLHGATSVVIKNHSGQLETAEKSLYYLTWKHLHFCTLLLFHHWKMFPISTHIRRGIHVLECQLCMYWQTNYAKDKPFSQPSLFHRFMLQTVKNEHESRKNETS